jgi:hypothetical protein
LTVNNGDYSETRSRDHLNTGILAAAKKGHLGGKAADLT